MRASVQEVIQHCEWCDGEQMVPVAAEEFYCRYCDNPTCLLLPDVAVTLIGANRT